MRAQKTIKDIARELGISPSTVSRALKDHPDISEKTKKAVNALAKEWNYKPNAVALSLRNSKTNIIGVVVPEIVHHFFSSIISGIQEEAQKLGYNVMIFQSNESYTQEVANVNALLLSRVDGVLIGMSKETHNLEHLKELLNDETPIVFFDRVCNELPVDNVIVDDFDSAFTAVEHLIKTGCRRIAHLSTPPELLLGQNRVKGYRQALLKHKIPVDEQLIVECDSYAKALEVTPELLNLPAPPDAILAVNELTAAGALKVIKKRGLKVPDDVSVIGFTDGVVSQTSDPELTTIDQHGFEVGKTACELLLKRIANKEDKIIPKTKVVKTNLIIRNSTKK